MNPFVSRSLRRFFARPPASARRTRLSARALEDRVVPSAPAAPPGFTSSLTSVTNTTPVTIDSASPNTQTTTMVVAGAGTYLHDVDVFTKLTHTWMSDMAISLTSPSGTTVTLTTFNGSSLDDLYNGTLWDDDADPGNPVPYTTPLAASKLVTDTVYTNQVVETELTPEEPLAAFRGENPNGTWTMTLRDDASADGGVLSEWKLDLTTLNAAPALAPAETFTNSTPVSISATGTPVITSQITVAGAIPYLQTLRLKTLLTHTNSAHLDISLKSPAGTVVTLTTDNGSLFDNVYNGTVWDDDADPGNVVPYSSANSKLVTDTAYANLVAKPTLTPEEPFGAFVGENPNGIWTLTISDDTSVDGGTLAGWDLVVVTPADTIAPEVTVNQAAGQQDPTNVRSLAYSIVFNEQVFGFDETDVSVASSIGGLQRTGVWSGTTYNLTVTVPPDVAVQGAVVVSVPPGAATDKAGNPNKASTSTDNSVLFDAVGPVVTVNQGATQPDPVAGGPIVFDVVFSEPPTVFDETDVNVASTVGVLKTEVSGSGTTYTVTVTVPDLAGKGTVAVSVPAGEVTDALGNPSSESTSDDNTVVVDTIGQVDFDPAVYAVAETGGTLTVTATRTGGSAHAVAVQYAADFGTATSGADYEPVFGTLSWANGETGPKTFVITLRDDVLVEEDETIGLTLSNPTNGLVLGTAATATVDLADLEEGLIQFKAASFEATEEGGEVTVLVSRTDGKVGDVEVSFATTEGGTARPGDALDYKAKTGTLSWKAGVEGTDSFKIQVQNDDFNEGRETIRLILSTPTNGSRLGLFEAEIVILPSDPKNSKTAGPFLDADGDAGVVRIVGGGTAEYYLTDPDGDSQGPIELIKLTGTDPARSVLTLSATKSKTSADGGLVALGAVTGTGLKALNARGYTLDGYGIDLTGPLGSLVIGSVVNGADIAAGGVPTDKTRITAGVIGDDTEVRLKSSLTSLTATRFGDGAITAPSVGLVAIKGNTRLALAGDFAADVTVLGDGVAAGKPAMQTLQVAGAVAAGSDLTVLNGTVGLVQAGSFHGSLTAGGLTAMSVKETMGGDLTLTGIGVPAGKPVLGSLTVGQHVQDGSQITAPSVGTMTVKGVMAGDVTVTGTVLPASKMALQTLRVTGAISGSDLLVDGSVGLVQVGGFRNSRLFAGYDGPDNGTGEFTHEASVGTFNVTGPDGGFENSIVVATAFRSVTLASIIPDNDPNNDGPKFGFRANHSIGSLRVGAPQPFVFVPSDLSIQGVEDFDVRIV